MITMRVVTNRVPEVMERVEKTAEAAKKAGIHTVAEGARRRVPVDTGELHDSITERGDGVEVGTDHALYVEFGTYKMAAEPFLMPSTPEGVAAMRAVLATAI